MRVYFERIQMFRQPGEAFRNACRIFRLVPVGQSITSRPSQGFQEVWNSSDLRVRSLLVAMNEFKLIDFGQQCVLDYHPILEPQPCILPKILSKGDRDFNLFLEELDVNLLVAWATSWIHTR